ncbi:hypothetical protein [Ruminococcus sp. 5_1_39BFAA]|uniref:hypothetical protein n=1 Tax=Ruminococcus sp. 5_1_39BFAA TaxID=457412 RepID=UPI003567A815
MRQKKIMKWFGIFFAVMMVFTVLSRAADSVNVAQVQVKLIQNQMVTHKVTGTGKVVGIREQAVFAQENLKVEQVLVQEGQSVKKGDVMLKLSLDSIQEALKDKNDEIEELNLRIKDLKSLEKVNSRKRAADQDWARRSYNISAQGSNISVDNARLEVQVAQQRLEDFYRDRELAQRQSLADEAEGFTDGAGGFTDNTGDSNESTDPENGFQDYTEETGKTENEGSESSMDYAAQEQALTDDLRAKQEALNSAIAGQNQELAAAGKTVEDASLPEASDSTLENVERQLANSQEDLEKLNQLLADEGNVKATADGVVKSLAAATGSITAESAAAVLYLTEGNLRMNGTIYEDDLKYVEIGAAVILKGSSGKDIQGASVESVREDETDPDARVISIQLPDSSLSIGETAEFVISKDAGPFNTCIPLSALHEENGSAYVYVIDSQNSVLGEVLVARRAEVLVKDKNQSLAALESGSLSSDQKIIVDADREISDGSRVRLQES